VPNLNIPIEADLLTEVSYVARKRGMTQREWVLEQLAKAVGWKTGSPERNVGIDGERDKTPTPEQGEGSPFAKTRNVPLDMQPSTDFLPPIEQAKVEQQKLLDRRAGKKVEVEQRYCVYCDEKVVKWGQGWRCEPCQRNLGEREAILR
jgi:hypothetical protein